MIVGEHDGGAYRVHGGHAVLGVPGLEIGMPVKALAVKTGLIVNTGLMHIGVAAENLAYATQQARILGQAAEPLGQQMHREQGTDLLAARLGDAELAAPEIVTT